MQAQKWEPPEPPEPLFRGNALQGVNSHTEGAQEIAWVTQKLLSSLQAQRDATLPKSQIALWGTGVLPPTP